MSTAREATFIAERFIHLIGQTAPVALWVLPVPLLFLLLSACLLDQPTPLSMSPLEFGPHKNPPLLPSPGPAKYYEHVATCHPRICGGHLFAGCWLRSSVYLRAFDCKQGMRKQRCHVAASITWVKAKFHGPCLSSCRPFQNTCFVCHLLSVE